MAKFAERLNAALKIRNITPAELAKRIGLNEGSLSNYRSGKYEPKQVRLEQIADVLHVSIPWLMGGDVPMTPSARSSATLIPVLGSVPAGIPIEAVEDIIDYEEISAEMARDGEYFALRIKGASMEPKFSEGDVVVIRKQEQVENGQIAVVMVNGDEATVKKFYKTDAGIMLVGLNPAFSPLTFTPEQAEQLPVRVIGRVVELRAKF
jgi:repressor LexA